VDRDLVIRGIITLQDIVQATAEEL
jgi:hypothetical protein